MWQRLREERGDSAIPFVTLFPLFLALMFFLVQVGMYYQAQMVAQAAADAGFHAARVADGSAAEGQAAAYQVISQHGSTLRGASVQIGGGGTQMTVTVQGTSQNLVGDWSVPPVKKAVSGPTERVVP
ncbi:TadE/TadG family type IV pilus assembly protein [Micrococcus luteus]|uniref:TadE/TadG family type IV pilus assembly protein n=1 Tax=Micrococcus luteus TaxID=1270 RepID=UPI002302C9B4|nr:TadE/TadG family type IV pilus assembly protein [Micrococcus luteus]